MEELPDLMPQDEQFLRSLEASMNWRVVGWKLRDIGRAVLISAGHQGFVGLMIPGSFHYYNRDSDTQ